MINAKTLIRCLAPLLMTLAAGCAPAYHSYSGCYVDCKYAPPPLPYVNDHGCVCALSRVDASVFLTTFVPSATHSVRSGQWSQPTLVVPTPR